MDESPPTAGEIRLDTRNLRGIAHPLRVRILGILRTDGPATASTLARRLGLNSGATSYHLRQLAEHGFVTDDPGHGDRRERWWRAAQWSTTLPDNALIDDDTGLGEVFLRSVAQVQADVMARAVDAVTTLPDPWRAVQEFSDYLLRLTPGQAESLAGEIHRVLRRYQAADPQTLREPREGTGRVTFQFQLLPHAEDLAPRADDDGTPR